MQQVVLITGGKGDLGQALCQTFESAAWRVLAPGRESLDVTDPDSVAAYYAQHPQVDLLVCNAGKIHDGLLLKQSENDWDAAVDVNLKGAMRCARAWSRGMLRRRSGQVVFISSFSAVQPPVGQANYAAAKAGLIGLGKSLASEWGSRNVRVNTILPGFMDGQMTAGLDPAVRAAALEKHVLGSFNTAAQVAEFVRFLHEGMPATSGQVFNLDSRVLR